MNGKNDTDDTGGTHRRTVLKTIGAGTTAAAIGAGATTAAIGTRRAPDDPAQAKIDDHIDLSAGGPHEVLVVFRSNSDVTRLGALDADWWRFETLPMGFAALTPAQIRNAATWRVVRGVYANTELEWHNDDARDVTGAGDVQRTGGPTAGYTGETVHAAVLDTGTDGDHPDLAPNLVNNWQFVGAPVLQAEPITWTDAGPVDTDENGHGTHTGGSIAATGAQSDGTFRGMAPDADLTVYTIGATLLLVFIVSAWDHLITRKRRGETNVQVVSNSYGPIVDGKDVDPADPINVAAWYAFRAGMVPVFSAGNSGPGLKTLSQHGKLPYTIGAAATNDDRGLTYFSGRGRPNPDYQADPEEPQGGGDDFQYDYEAYEPYNYDRKTALEQFKIHYDHTDSRTATGPFGVYRPTVGAPGNLVMSTLSPADALQAYSGLVGPDEQDTEVWYGKISGTSMSCPVTAGCAALVIDAYQQKYGRAPDPIHVINLIEATASHRPYADHVTEDEIEATGTPDDEVEDVTNEGEDKGEAYGPDDWGYTPENVGCGVVDTLAAVRAIESTRKRRALHRKFGFRAASKNIVSD